MAESELSQEKLVDIWLHHNDKIWKAVFITPVLAATILAGWFSLLCSATPIFQTSILVGGVIAMLLQFLVMHRMVQYSLAMHGGITVPLPTPSKPLFGLSAFVLVRSIPLGLALLFLTLIFAPADVRVCPTTGG